MPTCLLLWLYLQLKPQAYPKGSKFCGQGITAIYRWYEEDFQNHKFKWTGCSLQNKLWIGFHQFLTKISQQHAICCLTVSSSLELALDRYKLSKAPDSIWKPNSYPIQSVYLILFLFRQQNAIQSRWIIHFCLESIWPLCQYLYQHTSKCWALNKEPSPGSKCCISNFLCRLARKLFTS